MIPRKENLKLYLKHNGVVASNGRLMDLSGNGNHATIGGTQEYITNIFGKQTRLMDGTISQVTNSDVTESLNFSNYTELSLVHYGKLKSGLGDGNYMEMFPFNTGRFAIDQRNVVLFYLDNVRNWVTNLTAHPIIDVDKNHLLVVTYDKIRMKLFVDGILINSVAQTGDMVDPAICSSNRRILGETYASMIYNTALSPTEQKHLLAHFRNPHNIVELENTKDSSLMFHTNDGVKDITTRYNITNRGSIVGKEIVVDGADTPSGITVPIDNADFTGANGFTLSCVINPFSLGGASAGRFFDKSESTASVNGFQMYLTTSNRIAFRVENNITTNINAFMLNTFQHLIVTVTQAGLVNFYVNNISVATADQDTGSTSGITTSLPLGIGNAPFTTERNFDGIIRNARVFNKVLIPQERKDLYEKDMRCL